MKHLLTICILLSLNLLSAQTYPFVDGFETTISGQIPAGYSGDIPVLNYHGLNDLKGLAALLFSGDTEDSIISPLIGPLTQNSIMVFHYRWVRDNIYPSEPKMPRKGDKMELLFSTDDGLSFQSVHIIDSFNHQPNLNFRRVQLSVGSYAGETIRFKFKCERGTDRYFMDIDSVSIQNAGGVSGIDDASAGALLSVFPNPASQNIQLNFPDCPGSFKLVLSDLNGRNLIQKQHSCDEPLHVGNLMSGVYFIQADKLRTKLLIAR